EPGQRLFQRMDLLTERRRRDMLALRRVGEAALLRDSDKIPELMNFHRLDFRRSTLHCSRFLLLCLRCLISDLWIELSVSVFQLFRFSAFRRSDTPLGPSVCLRPADRMGEHTRLACPARCPCRA